MLLSNTVVSMSSKINTTPPEKGSFPLDHFHECKTFMEKYMACMKRESNTHLACREETKAYVQNVCERESEKEIEREYCICICLCVSVCCTHTYKQYTRILSSLPICAHCMYELWMCVVASHLL